MNELPKYSHVPNLDRVFLRYLGTGDETYQLHLCDDFGSDIITVDKARIESVTGLEVLALFLDETGLVPMLTAYDDEDGPCLKIDGVLFVGAETAPIVAPYKVEGQLSLNLPRFDDDDDESDTDIFGS